MADKIALGKQFLTDLLARIPEDQRAALQPVLEADDVADFVGGGVLRQSDYSRGMNELSAKHQELTDWFNVNKADGMSTALLPQDKAALAAAAAGKVGDPSSQPAGVDLKAVTALIDERERGVAAYMAATTSLALKHFKEFGEELNLTDLLADPDANKIGILGVYDRKFAPKYQEKATAAENARIDAKVKEGIAEERKKLIQNPYPVASPNGDVSPLSALQPNPGDTNSVQDLVDAYNVLAANKQSATA